MMALQNFAFSEHFGWTPKQIEELDILDRLMYVHLLKGFSEAKPDGIKHG